MTGTGLRLEEFLPYRFAVLAGEISKQLSLAYSEKFGLTIPEWRIMANLGELPDEDDTLSPQAVSERGHMDKAKVSRAIASMVEAGLLVRETDPRDHRAALLRLSKKGRAVYLAKTHCGRNRRSKPNSASFCLSLTGQYPIRMLVRNL